MQPGDEPTTATPPFPRDVRHVRLRITKDDKRKALQQYQDLRRSKPVAKALVIAELEGGDLEILGQGLTAYEINFLLLCAADALAEAEEQRSKAVTGQPHIEPMQRGVHNGMSARRKEIATIGGVLVPPAGENLISCGVCQHPQWFVLFFNASQQPARFACCHCGNEIKTIPAFDAGHA